MPASTASGRHLKTSLRGSAKVHEAPSNGTGAAPVPFDGASWTFAKPRSDVFRCLPLAVEAGKAGNAYPVALNAANEVVVQTFLDRRIQFLRVPDVIEEVLEAVPEFGAMESMQAIVSVDSWAREEANRAVIRRAR